jgi:hypothetical protein
MSGSITINPYGTSQPQNSFLLQTQGYVQGVSYDDPTARMELAAGTLASTETVVMWGGVPITELINVTGAGADGLGPVLKRATSQATVTGMSVFNMAMHMIQGPGASVPVAGTGNSVNFYRFGTNQRIAVAIDQALLTAITGAGLPISGQSLYWSVTNFNLTNVTTGGNFLMPASTRILSTNTNSKTIATGTNGVGPITWTTGPAAMILI